MLLRAIFFIFLSTIAISAKAVEGKPIVCVTGAEGSCVATRTPSGQLVIQNTGKKRLHVLAGRTGAIGYSSWSERDTEIFPLLVQLPLVGIDITKLLGQRVRVVDESSHLQMGEDIQIQMAGFENLPFLDYNFLHIVIMPNPSLIHDREIAKVQTDPQKNLESINWNSFSELAREREVEIGNYYLNGQTARERQAVPYCLQYEPMTVSKGAVSPNAIACYKNFKVPAPKLHGKTPGSFLFVIYAEADSHGNESRIADFEIWRSGAPTHVIKGKKHELPNVSPGTLIIFQERAGGDLKLTGVTLALEFLK